MSVKPSAAYTLKDQDAKDPALLMPTVHVIVTPPQGGILRTPLGMDPLVLGTSGECDVILADAKVSRRHCELRLTPRGIALRDLGSKNGTIVGEVQILEVILPLGVPVSLGNSRLVAHLEGAPAVVPLHERGRFGDALGESVPMRALFARLERAAGAPETVVLIGEPGTGKEILARGVHAAGPRQDGPFQVLRCGGVAPALIKRELFGADGAVQGADGAGLFEQARGGTLLIDDLGELPLELQPRLLAALDARAGGAPAPRVVGGTRRSLRGRLAEGSLREDLHRRLAVHEVRVPALRDRRGDIPVLVEHFLGLRSPPRRIEDLPPNTMEMLTSHDWPGNVRELRSTVARLAVFAELPGGRSPQVHSAEEA